MEWRHAAGVPGRRRRLGILLIAAALQAVGATPTWAAPLPACRVTNASGSESFTTLQAALGAASRGDRLVVRGTCSGGASIDKGIVVVGLASERTGTARLTGDRKVRVLDIAAGIRVKLRDLQIVRGWAHRGAGIRNRGNLILADVTVRGSATSKQLRGDGGGVYNRGRLVLNGATRIADNYAGGSGGVLNEGTLVMNGSSAIVGNDSYFGDAGVRNAPGATLIMNGEALIRGGLSAYGVGGVGNFGTLEMNDASSIRHNATWEDEGEVAGVYNAAIVTMNDTSSISGHREGAVDNYGKFTMNGSSSIDGNRYFGAVNNDGTFTMNDASSVRDNTGGCAAAGVWNAGRLTMTGSSTITGNTVTESYWGCEGEHRGAGVYHARGRLVGVVCGPGGNVYGNTPDDCFIESP
jgi:hypothetical protein